MGIGISIFLFAVGAILWFAVTAEVSGVSLDAVGLILMTVGAIGLLWSLLAANAIGPFGRERVHVEERH